MSCSADGVDSGARTGTETHTGETGDTGPEGLEQELAALVATAEEEMEALGISAMSLAVIRGGEVAWSQGFGTRTPEGSEGVDSATRFRVASVTKPMTAIATLQQVDQGCLELGERVNSYFSFDLESQPGLTDELLVEQTLNHTGGLVDYEVQTGHDTDGLIEVLLRAFENWGLFLSPPGRMFNYSNMNFVVAGRLVEVCSGMDYRPYMEESVWSPLGMTRTTLDTGEIVEDANYASGVTMIWAGQEGESVVVDAESYASSALWPTMGAWSSADDLANLGVFLMSGDSAVLSEERHGEMVSKQVDREEGYPDKGYGYGLTIKNGIDIGGAHYPVTMLYHTGTLFGYTSHLYVVPELGVGVVALLNREFMTPSETLTAALNLSAWVDAVESPQEPVDTTRFSEFVGTYTNDLVMGDFVFSLEGDTLRVDVPSLEADGISYQEELTAVRPDNFVMTVDGGSQDLTFIRDDSGAVEYVRNRYYVGLRVDRLVSAPVRAPIPAGWKSSQWRDAQSGFVD